MDFLKNWIKSGSSKNVEEPPKEVVQVARSDYARPEVVDVVFE